MNSYGASPFHRVQSCRSQLLQHASPFGPPILPENSPHHGLSMDCCCVQDTFTCFSVRPSMGCRVTACVTTVLLRDCRKISALTRASPCPPPTSLTLCLHNSFSHIFSFHSSGTAFSAFLKYIFIEALQLLLINSVLTSSRSFLEMAGPGSVRHGGHLLPVL